MAIYGKKQRHLVENVSWQIVKSNDSCWILLAKILFHQLCVKSNGINDKKINGNCWQFFTNSNGSSNANYCNITAKNITVFMPKKCMAIPGPKKGTAIGWEQFMTNYKTNLSYVLL